PTSGIAGISQSGGVVMLGSRSPLQEVDLVDVDGLRVAEERDENREANRGLGRRDGDDEEDDDLPLVGPERGAVAEEGEVRRVHHELDRQEDLNRVAAEQRPRDADRKQRARGEQDVRQRDRSDHGAFSRRASTKAPTSAASRSTETASKWSR